MASAYGGSGGGVGVVGYSEENQIFYARVFLVIVVVLFLWFLYRRRRRYAYKPIKRYHGETTQFGTYLDRYAKSVVATGRNNLRQTIDSATTTFGMPSVFDAGGGGATSLASGITIGGVGAAATSAPQSRNKSEEECRRILERLLGAKFDSVRPDFLRNPRTGKNLEMDCYNAQLALALEYNGQQHYKYTPYFHRTKANFYSQVHRDDWKRRTIRQNGIKIIEVPYWIRPNRLEDYIRTQLRKNGYRV